MKRKVKLLQIENDRALRPETDTEYFDALQRSLLLVLKEDGLLNEAQLLRAEEIIKTQKSGSMHLPGR
ncbi:MAG: hypothetical protein ACI3VA_11525 [Candidatus Limivicinus sp.]